MEIDLAGLREDYARDGMVARLPLLKAAEARHFRGKLEGFIAAEGDAPGYRDWTYFKGHLVLRWLAELAGHPAILRAVTALIGPDILLWGSFLPVKPPRSEGYFGWHQDATYWPLAPIDKVVTLWLALSEVTPANGAMRMLPASHRRGQLPHELIRDPASMLRRGQRVTAPLDEGAAVEISLEPGEASLHHPLTLHGSSGNESDHWRLAVGLNFVAGAVKATDGARDSALLLQGTHRPGGLEPETFPEADLHPGALARYRQVVERLGRRYSGA